jgi:hypothetical protein
MKRASVGCSGDPFLADRPSAVASRPLAGRSDGRRRQHTALDQHPGIHRPWGFGDLALARAPRVGLIGDLEEFVHDHRPHGCLTAHATPPAWNGYLLTVACPCGVVFERWVTPEDADADLVRIARLN